MFKKMVLIPIILMSTLSFSKAEIIVEKHPREEEVLNAIKNTNLEDAVKDACEINKYLCKTIVKKVYPKFKKNNKYMLLLYYISKVESGMIYRVGIYDKDDITFFQLSWKNPVVKQLAKKYNISKKELIYNTEVAAKIALRILIINTAFYVKKRGYIPKYYQDIIPLYHSPLRIRKAYLKKVIKVMRTSYKPIFD